MPVPTETADPEINAASSSVAAVAPGFSFGALIFGLVFVAACAALFAKFNGVERVRKALGFGGHRYRSLNSMDLEASR